MTRERALKVLLVVVGLAFLAAGYIAARSLMGPSDISPGDQMIMGLYLPFGVFLLLAVRNPAANRTLIAAVGWSNLAHMAVMTVQGLRDPNHAPSDWAATLVISLVSVTLLLLNASVSPRRARASGTPVPAAGD